MFAQVAFEEEPEIQALLARAAENDQHALSILFSRYRERLKRMIALRLNRRLQARVDASDILQDSFLEVARRLPDYVAAPRLPFFLWLRRLTGLKLIEVHRRHLGTRRR